MPVIVLTRGKVFLAITIVLFMVLVVILALSLSHEAPAAIVKGRSMFPLLREGDIIFILRCSPEEIRTGDVVIYRSRYGGRLIIHRVIDIKYKDGVRYFVTKGDNNPGVDFTEFDSQLGVNQARIVGKVFSINNYVFKVPYIGNLALVIRGG